MRDPVLSFYDEMADDYHLLFEDWQKGVHWQGEVLDAIVRREMGGPPMTLLDCACGIGTQAIGLALRGYNVHATDITAASVERAKREAESLGVSITTGVADFRMFNEQVAGTFDVVIACDNSLAHMLTADDLSHAVQSMRSKLKPNGLLLASIRDYDEIILSKPDATMPRVFDGPTCKRISFQSWDWDDEKPIYTVHQFVLLEANGEWRTVHSSTMGRAVQRAEITEALDKAGLSDVRWLMSEESGYYQPVVIARNRDR